VICNGQLGKSKPALAYNQMLQANCQFSHFLVRSRWVDVLTGKPQRITGTALASNTSFHISVF